MQPDRRALSPVDPHTGVSAGVLSFCVVVRARFDVRACVWNPSCAPLAVTLLNVVTSVIPGRTVFEY